MSTVFLRILNMSIAASWLIVAVLLVRFLLKKAPKWISCVLWALVAMRLVIPFSFQSSWSLVPSGETITYKTVEDTQNEEPAKTAEPGAASADPLTPSDGSKMSAPRTRIPVIDSGIKVIDNALNPVIERAYKSENRTPAQTAPSTPSTNIVPADPSASEAAPAPVASKADPMKTWTLVAAIVWISGMAALLIYAFVSYLRLRKKVSASIPVRDNIRAADGIKTPFILGILKPVIYVPSMLQGEAMEYVLAHEEAHLKRRDHLWKPLGYLLLAIYWFNPLCWLAYILLTRDIESACDEKAVRFMDHEEVAEYSQTLLKLSIERHQIAACPVAFGDVNVKKRIKGILNYRKPAFCVVLVALIACVAVAGCFLTDPKKETDPGSSETQSTEAPSDPTEEPAKETTEATKDPSKGEGETDPSGGSSDPEPYTSKPVDSARIDLTLADVTKKGEGLNSEDYQSIYRFLSRDGSLYPWNFINQSYHDPSEIDLYLLMRDGTDRDLPEKECVAAWTAANLLDLRLGPQKRTKESVRELFLKYTGKEPTDEQMKAFSQWLYLPEYDAYYSFVTDAAEDLRVWELGIARRLSAQDANELGLPVHEDGLIALNWKGGHPDFATEGLLLLIPDGDSFKLAANLVFDTAPNYEYVPGEATVEMKTKGGADFINISDEEEKTLQEYFRLRALERADPLRAREAIEASSLFASAEIGEMFTKRSIRCMEQINAIQASFVRVAVTCTIQSFREVGYEKFIQCKEDYTIDYQVKGSDKVDQFQDGSVMTIVMERSHIVPLQYAKYSLTMSYGGVLDESPDEETILQEYRNYRKDHPVTDEMIGEAKAQITEELKKRIEKAVEEGTWGLSGFQKEDVPKLLEGIRIYPAQEENEEAAVLSTAQGYRMPFRQHKAVFAMDYEFLVTDPKTGETLSLSPFGRRTRVFFVGYGVPLEYADMMEA